MWAMKWTHVNPQTHQANPLLSAEHLSLEYVDKRKASEATL